MKSGDDGHPNPGVSSSIGQGEGTQSAAVNAASGTGVCNSTGSVEFVVGISGHGGADVPASGTR